MDNGELYTWGSGKRGQLGHGKTSNLYDPHHVMNQYVMSVFTVSCGSNHTLCVESDEGLVFGFGANSDGQLGVGNKVDQTEPVRARGVEL